MFKLDLELGSGELAPSGSIDRTLVEFNTKEEREAFIDGLKAGTSGYPSVGWNKREDGTVKKEKQGGFWSQRLGVPYMEKSLSHDDESVDKITQQRPAEGITAIELKTKKDFIVISEQEILASSKDLKTLLLDKLTECKVLDFDSRMTVINLYAYKEVDVIHINAEYVEAEPIENMLTEAVMELLKNLNKKSA